MNRMPRPLRHPVVHRLRFATNLLILAMMLLGITIPASSVASQVNPTPSQTPTATPIPASMASEQALSLLQQMTPEERIGQLFLVSFKGNVVEPGSEIDQLIRSYHISGVILTAENDNFTDRQDTVASTIALTRQLQTAAFEASQVDTTDQGNTVSTSPLYIPLFIGISQEGDGYPYDQILSGLTPLPNQMAIGGTWNPELSRQVGNVLGSELSELGFNLLLGPSLDVLDNPISGPAGDLGTRTFGGDPYWVGKHGQSYVEGVHQGSQGRVAVIAKYFPGHGGSDRLPEEEVATVRKSLEQLIHFELEPFFDVTGQAASSEATADGLLTAHIRYQGFQGNIRATTRPVSFDPQALKLLLGLPEFSEWRNNGGLMVSDNLGGKAIRGFYELTSQVFDMPRRVALNAFLAGNDLLYVGDFSSGENDSFTTARRTFEFFSQKFREDPAFAQRVDESVLRILSLKLRLYPQFSPQVVLVPETTPETINQSSQVTFDVARQSALLISPSQAELDENIPDPPNQNDRIVFITDTRTAQQCSQCDPKPLMSEKAFEQSVLRLYGPQAGGLVSTANLISYTMADLEEMLANPKANLPVERSLNRANWIVFSLLDYNLRYPSYQTLSQFLSDRPDLFQKKRLIVFSFNAPYFLDATNISKLTAYYGLYSKSAQFIDIAAYLLFQELRAESASPVSITGISYDLNSALFPNPDITIPIELDLPLPVSDETQATPVPIPPPIFRIGDIVPVRTGVILDNNSHAVPDGTPVEFTFTMNGQANPVRQLSITSNGIAQSSYAITEGGVLEIQATSDPASSDILRIDIPNPIADEEVTPTFTPTPEPTPTPTPTFLPVITQVETETPAREPSLGDWLMSLLLSSGLAWLAYKYFSNAINNAWGVRTGLLMITCSLLAYTYLILELPGTEAVQEMPVSQLVLLFTLSGAVIGLLVSGFWRSIQRTV